MDKISLLFAFSAMLFWGIGDFLIQKTVKKIGDLETTVAIGIIGMIGLFPFVKKDIASVFTSTHSLTPLFVSGILILLATLALLESMKRGKLSVVEVVVTLELPMTIMLGLNFFGERLMLGQWVIIGFLLFGIFLSSTDFSKIKRKHFLEKGVLLAVIAAIISASVNFMMAFNVKNEISPFLVIWFPWAVCVFVSIPFIYFREGLGLFLSNMKKFKLLVLITGLIDTFAWLFFSFAVQKSELSLIATITESYVAVAVFLGLVFNKEKITKYQAGGAILSLCSSFAIGFF